MGPIALFRVEPGRRYKARYVVRRRTNSPDPDNDAVRLALRWFDQSKAPLAGAPGTTVVLDLLGFNTGSGRQSIDAVVAREAGDAVEFVAPAGTRYARPFVQTYGLGSITDIEVVDFVDVTDATLYAPDVSDFNDRLTAVESLDLGDRVDALEIAAGSPETLTVVSIPALEALNVPASVQTINLQSGATEQDGLGGQYWRSDDPTPVQSLDGAYWTEVNPLLLLADEPTAIAGVNTREGMTPATTRAVLSDAGAIDLLGGMSSFGRDLAKVASPALGRTLLGAGRATELALRDYAAGDGSTPDSDALEAAINAGGGVQGIVEGEGRTYKLDRAIELATSNVTFRNIVFDARSIENFTRAILMQGVQGTATNLLGGWNIGDYVLTVGDTAGFAAGQEAWLNSTAIWDTETGTTLGQIVVIAEVLSSTEVRINRPLTYSYGVEGLATLSPLTMRRKIRFENCDIIGQDTGEDSVSLIYLDKCADVTFDNVNLKDGWYLGAGFNRCSNVDVRGGSVRNFRMPGTGYGYGVFGGTDGASFSGVYAADVRHMMTTGDNKGINRNVTCVNNKLVGIRDSGLDFHQCTDFATCIGNVIEVNSDDYEGGSDGITFTGLNFTAVGNTIEGARYGGIRHNCGVNRGRGKSTIANNIIRLRSGGSPTFPWGIEVRNNSGGTGSVHDAILSPAITGNVLSGALGFAIDVYALKGSITGVAITGNVGVDATASHSMLVRADPGVTISEFAITGNDLKTSGSSVNLVLGSSGGGTVSGGTISGNRFSGGNYGTQASASNWTESGNSYNNTTLPVLVASGTNIRIDPQTIQPQVVTTFGATVRAGTPFVDVNVAGAVTLTLPGPDVTPNAELKVRTRQAQTVASASSNVIAKPGTGAAGTAILPATSGAWAILKSNGTAWFVIASGI